jgi:hypothetical protein
MYSLEVGSEASADAGLLRWRVNGHEDKVGLTDAFVDVCAKEEVATASLADNVNESRLVDGQLEVG